MPPAQQLNRATGLGVGGFNRAVCYRPRDIDPDFYARNRKILAAPRGTGYWLWKPYFIVKSLAQLADGDMLFYCDAGATFIRPIDPLVRLSAALSQDVIPFELTNRIEKQWTKRNALTILNCDSAPFTDTDQRLGGFILCRNSPRSRAFMARFLECAQDERLITDSENQLGLPNYEGFQQHRHDQSLFSLLSKQHGYRAFRDPSQWGNDAMPLYPESNYEQLIDLTRNPGRPALAARIVREFKRLTKRLPFGAG